jgi:hypothetical protein
MVKSGLRILGRSLQLLLAAGIVGWTALALHFQVAMPWRLVGYAALAGAALALLRLAFRGRWGRVWGAMAGLVAAVAIWWSTIEPRADRLWQADVAHGVTAEIDGSRATLHNIRNFDWISEEDAVARWETRVVDLDAITSLDLFLSVWDHPDIAHTLVSFGFADGQHIVLSGEIRKEQGEAFSSVGGFFRQFELVLIAADERDIIRLRTDLRQEEVSVYPITLDAATRRALFESFLALGNALDRQPRWYNTLTANCTTVPYRLVAQLSDKVVLDPRVILSGRLPGYLHDLGVLRPEMTEADIRARARLGRLGPAIPDGAEFSRRIRLAWAP